MVDLGTLIHQAKVVRCGEGNYPVLSMTMHDGLVFQNDKFKKTIASKDKSDYKVVKRNQLVISFPIDEGVLATQRIVDAGIVSPAYGIWDIDQEMILPEFLEYALRCDRALNYYKAKLRGSTARRRSLPTSTLLAYTVPLPDISEQEHILNVVHKTQKVISGRTEEISLLDNLIKARFVELFGDPISNSHALPEATLPELGEFGRGVSKHRPRNDPKLLGGKYPLIQTGDVASANLYITSYTTTYSELGLTQSKMWDKGTLCITIAANIAKTAILNFDACFPDSIVGFSANGRTNNIFIHYWFSFFQEILESQAPESAQKNINLKILSELKVIVPAKEKQDVFAAFVEQVDKLKAAVQKSLDEAQLLFDSLMQKYFG